MGREPGGDSSSKCLALLDMLVSLKQRNRNPCSRTVFYAVNMSMFDICLAISEYFTNEWA